MFNRRAADWNGFAPRLGWQQGDAWLGELSHTEFVRVTNPDDGILMSANNDVLRDLVAKEQRKQFTNIVNMHMGNHRSARIKQLLKKTDKHTVDDSKNIVVSFFFLCFFFFF